MGKKKMSEVSCCEIGGPQKAKGDRPPRSVFYRHKGDFRWQGIRQEPYKTKGDEWSNVIRRVLIGSHGETTKFHVRYFEILPGGNSSLEKHGHEHVVICVKGEGLVRTGRRERRMAFMDIAYISPQTVHQLRNPFNEAFGFLCIVNAKRDRPKVLAV